MSDAEMLEQTAEWLSRLAETIERVTERLADSISKLQAEQERQAHLIELMTQRLDNHHRWLKNVDERLNRG